MIQRSHDCACAVEDMWYTWALRVDCRLRGFAAALRAGGFVVSEPVTMAA